VDVDDPGAAQPGKLVEFGAEHGVLGPADPVDQGGLAGQVVQVLQQGADGGDADAGRHQHHPAALPRRPGQHAERPLDQHPGAGPQRR
jgi:hypothetical protein